MKRVLLAVFLLGIVFIFAACGIKETGNPGKALGGVSRENPIEIDKDNKAITIYAEVNGKYFTTPTRHGVVFKDGSNGEKSVLKSWANQLDLHQALLDIGAVPGDNVTLETKNAVVEGSEMGIKVNWEGAGKEYDISEVVKDDFGKGFVPRFGGNKDRSAEIKTGCIFCLDACPVGITSNSSYPQGSFDGGEARFFGNQEVLPKDGTPVAVTFSLK